MTTFALKSHFEAFCNLLFPKLCSACGDILSGNESCICTTCLLELPLTNYWKHADNPIEKLFWGKVPILNASAFLFFDKESKYQRMLHMLKYKGRQQIGLFLGRLYGQKLSQYLENIPDIIIPVPLHKSRLLKRGYNQSELIANGMGESLNIPVNTNVVKRIVATKSQTKKGKYERWLNVKGIFKCYCPEVLESKHVLVVDDIITTGSTIESLIHELLQIPNVKISVASLASA